MYYVIQVAPREEEKIVEIIKKAISKELCRECFFPMRAIRRKICGEFTNIREKLFPGYIFVKSDRPQELYETLKKITHLTKMLGIDFDEESQSLGFTELPENEIAWIMRILSEDDQHIVPLSQVSVDDNGNVEILSRALTYMAERVLKYDLHKRIAKIQVEFKGKPTVLHLGIEIIKG